jgi:hypothetical protein
MTNNFFILQILKDSDYNILGYYKNPDTKNYDSFLLTQNILDAKLFKNKNEASRIAEYFRGHGYKIKVVEITKYDNGKIDNLKIREADPDYNDCIRTEISYKGIYAEHYGESYTFKEKEIFKSAVDIQREILKDRFIDIFPDKILKILDNLSDKEFFYDCISEENPDFNKIKKVKEEIAKLIS